MGAPIRRKAWLPAGSFAGELNRVRCEKGLSTIAIAERVGAGLVQQNVSIAENPHTNLTIKTMEKIAGGLGCRLEIKLIDGVQRDWIFVGTPNFAPEGA